MSEWHEGLTDEHIEQLKNNERPLGLCPCWMRVALIDMPNSDLQVYFNGWKRKPETLCIVERLDRTYRLRPDWNRPEKTKQGRWEYCEVFVTPTEIGFTRQGMSYHFMCDEIEFGLAARENIVGFGGIEFKEEPGKFYGEIMGVNASGETVYLDSLDCVRPATPNRVRFFVEGK